MRPLASKTSSFVRSGGVLTWVVVILAVASGAMGAGVPLSLGVGVFAALVIPVFWSF